MERTVRLLAILLALFSLPLRAETPYPVWLLNQKETEIAQLKKAYQREMDKLKGDAATIDTWARAEAKESRLVTNIEEAQLTAYWQSEQRRREAFLTVGLLKLAEDFNSEHVSIERRYSQQLERANYSPRQQLRENPATRPWLSRLENSWADERSRRTAYASLSTLTRSPPPMKADEFTTYKEMKLLSTVTLEGISTTSHPELHARFWKALLAGQKDDFTTDSEGNVSLNGRRVVVQFFYSVDGKTPAVTKADEILSLNSRLKEVALEVFVNQPRRKRLIEQVHAARVEMFPAKALTPYFGDVPTEVSSAQPLELRDRFNRKLEQITLTDWEGPVSNPALSLKVKAPYARDYPTTVTLSTNSPDLYFDLPSEVGPTGATKILHFREANDEASFHLALWPVEEGAKEATALTIRSQGQDVRYPIWILRHDRLQSVNVPVVVNASPFPYTKAPLEKPYLVAPWPYLQPADKPTQSALPFSITLDFSHDRSEFFSGSGEKEQSRRAIVQQAANDWAFFMDNLYLDPVRKGDEETLLRQQGKATRGSEDYRARNQYDYKDFLLYVMGSNSSPAAEAFGGGVGQGLSTSRGRVQNGLRRSGQTLFEGVWSKEGYKAIPRQNQWWEVEYADGKPVDLYSYAVHEIGHALFAHQNYPVFNQWIESGEVSDMYVQEYQRAVPAVERATAHLPKEIDRASRRGAFGAIEGSMPQKRWLLTKLDLLMLRATGYRLRDVDVFRPFKWTLTELVLPANRGEPFRFTPSAEGGLLPYCWKIESGRLPEGLTLDSFSGKISGSPRESGVFYLVLNVRDQEDTVGISRAVHITVN